MATMSILKSKRRSQKRPGRAAHGSLDSVVLQVVSAGWEKFGYEPNTKLPDGAQMIDGEWYTPKWGCDSLEASLDALQAILQNAEIADKGSGKEATNEI